MTDQSLCWFAVYTKARHERLAADALEGRGFEILLPLCTSRRRWSDRIKELNVPLFSRYLFCRFHLQERSLILRTSGVQCVIGSANIPVPIPDAEIAALVSVMKSGRAVQPWSFLRTGQWVRIVLGPLAGLEGILLDYKRSNRLVISIALLQRSVAVRSTVWM
jgi:transcription antitermination factor NusG